MNIKIIKRKNKVINKKTIKYKKINKNKKYIKNVIKKNKVIKNKIVKKELPIEFINIDDNTTLQISINEINNITRQLNEINISDKLKNKRRERKLVLMEYIINNPNFDKNNKYFLMPLIHPDLYISYNSIIVGNSKSLLYYNYGNEIDSFDNIFRFNYAYTKNLEQYCGGKTTHRVCSLICLKGIKPLHHPFIENMDYKLYLNIINENIICFYKKMSDKKEIKQIYKSNINNKFNKLYTIYWNKQYFNDVSKFYGIQNKLSPQCGTGFMLLFIDMGIYINTYGFDTKLCDDNYYYYWDTLNKKCKKLSISHNYEWEFSIVNILNDKKYINLKTFNIVD